jgi:predicted nuclease with TOPRIM domain
MKVEKNKLSEELKSIQVKMTKTSNELGFLSKEIAFLRENLKMLRSK